jgi:nitroreductase/NAD-dependent dihydropyrimidine dehydrogenase PreA subunit
MSEPKVVSAGRNVKVDSELCKSCGLCISECPFQVLEKGPQGRPVMGAGKEPFCIQCGHCEASCPQQAIYLESSGLQGSPLLTAEKISKEEIDRHIRSRRSIRRHKNESVDKKTLEALMDTVRYAPSGHNEQNVKWLMIRDKAELNKVNDILLAWLKQIAGTDSPFAKMFDVNGMIEMWENGINPIFYDAPHLAVTYTHKDAMMGLINSTIALAYLDVALPAYGLGSCWAGFFYVISMLYPELAKKIGLPDEHVITGGMMFGYPKSKFHNIPKRNKIDLVWK